MFKKIALGFLFIFVFFFLLLVSSMIGKAPQEEDISWGVTFSQKYARDLGLDWREAYLAMFDDLGVKKVRIPIYWDFVEGEEGNYYFEEVDWMFEQALEREVEIMPAIGMRVPRWPECHLPDWAEQLEKDQQQEKILELLEEIVLRYRGNESIVYWQVENEPFLTTFGECPWADKNFLKQEVDLVRSLDPERPILISESGELSTWFKGAQIADTVGTSIYRQTWWHAVGGVYTKIPIRPVHYYRKSQIIDRLFQADVICTELQAEPWGPAPTFIISLEEQEKSMNIDIFKDNIEYAKRTGLPEFYLWGVEWWYWMKEVHEQDEFWEEARELFK